MSPADSRLSGSRRTDCRLHRSPLMFQLQPRLRMRVEEVAGRTVAYLNGQLDSHSTPEFKKLCREILAGTAHSVDVNLAGVTRMDGMGLASLVGAWRVAETGGKEFRLLQMGQPTRELVERMNLHLLLRIIEEG